MKQVLTLIVALSLSFPAISSAEVILAGCNVANNGNYWQLQVSPLDMAAQTFTTPNDGNSYVLTSVYSNQIKKNSGTPTGTNTAHLYATTGSNPSTVPTGSALANSAAVNTSALPTTYGSATTTYSFSDGFVMSPNTTYAIVWDNTIDNDPNEALFGDQTAGGCSGNAAFFRTTWTASQTIPNWGVYGTVSSPASTPKKPRRVLWFW